METSEKTPPKENMEKAETRKIAGVAGGIPLKGYTSPAPAQMLARAGCRRLSDFDAKFPRPWRVEKIVQPQTKTCHHPAPSWIIVDARGRRVFWTEQVVARICAAMNAEI